MVNLVETVEECRHIFLGIFFPYYNLDSICENMDSQKYVVGFVFPISNI